ncbi:hypothetical protein H920_11999 [Fukomys damarensis]|uniref:Uncharacterized protein n=1 Tax=Fukomys damarensis TaxID=885580 RepID=A0A091D8M2_FUKDA|nr:hypothetical protein H920_11999 [Fukomys damarensis]
MSRAQEQLAEPHACPGSRPSPSPCARAACLCPRSTGKLIQRKASCRPREILQSLTQSELLGEDLSLALSLSVMVDSADGFMGTKLSTESGLFLCNQISYRSNRLIHYSCVYQG